MRKIKKSLMACLIAIFALTLGAGFASMPKANEAKAAVPASYKTVETSMMAQIKQVYNEAGRFNLAITMPDLDSVSIAAGEYRLDTAALETDLPTILRNLGLYDHVKVAGKTLTEWGDATCYDNFVLINQGGPANYTITFPLQVNKDAWMAAVNSGEVTFTKYVDGAFAVPMCEVEILEGALIPGYDYLSLGANPTVFKAGCDFVTEGGAYAYDVHTTAKTDVLSVVVAQDNKDGSCYFGVNLRGDDYAGSQLEVNQNYAYNYVDKISVNGNGVTGVTGKYGLYGLGSKGAGHYAFHLKADPTTMESITIPAGTLFPSRAMTTLKPLNAGNVTILYETQNDVTFVKDAFGNWVIEGSDYETETEVVMASPLLNGGKTDDYFLSFELSVSDYAGLNTYAGNAMSASQFLNVSNFTTHVLLNDNPFPVKGETYLCVWGTPNVFTTRGNVSNEGFPDSAAINRITILAGCQFPSYEMLETGVAKYYVTTEDVTFVRSGDAWIKEVAFDLEAYQAEKIAELQAYRRGEVENEADREELVEIGIEWITASTDKEEVDGALADIKVEIDDLPAKADVSALVAAAKAELDAYLVGDYDALKALDRASAIAQGKALIEAATTEAEVAETLADAKALVDLSLARVANYVDVTAIVKIMNCYQPGGNFFLQIIIPEIVATESEQEYAYRDVNAILTALGLWDNVYVGERSLREWGVTGGWDNAIGYNVSEPDNNIYIHCHSEEWKTSDVTFESGIVSNYTMSIKAGALIPSQAYFTGAETYDIYRVRLEMVSEDDAIAYSFKAHADTDVVDVQLAQDNGDSVYLAIGLSNNDFPTEGGYVEVADYYYGEEYNSTAYWVNVRINGANGVSKYAIYNLNEGGNGRIALTVGMPYAQVNSITIPAGTTFPTYAIQKLPAYNGGNVLVVVLKTTTDVTFVKTADGSWVEFSGYKANALETLENAKNEKVEADYFADDFAVIVNAYQEAKTAIENATAIADIDNALATAIEAMNAASTKTGVIAAAKEELAAYKAGMFREAEEAQRLAIVAAGQADLDACANADALAAVLAEVKADIDTLKTAAEYADEELAAQKAAAREEIANYLDKANYYADEQAEIDLVIAAGHQGVADATNEDEIAQAVVDAKADLDEILTKEEVVEAIKADLNAYKAEGVFREEEQAERDAIVAEALAALEGLTDKAEIDAIVEAAKAEIDELTTADEYLEAELASAKKEAIVEVESYRADGDYIPSQVEHIEEVIAEALEAIAEAKSLEAIAEAVEVAKAYIDEIADSVTIVDTAMMVKISDIHHNGGNLNMFVIIPGLDLPDVLGDGKVFDQYSKETLEALFNDFGLYDMIYINDKSLRDWGFVGFWNDSVGFNVDAPNPAIYLHMHTDNPDYAAAVESGEITFTSYEGTSALVIKQSPITVKQGLLIPGYAYLNGDENAVVYRAVADFVTEGAHRPYDLEATATTNVESIVYVQEDRDPATNEFAGFGYFGFSLEGDDYPAFEGDPIEVNATMLNYVNYDAILINGEEGLVNRYSLYNLGEKGRGYIAVQITIPEADMYSITIPEGIIFPAYASNLMPEVNSGNNVFFLYRTTEEVTFVKTAEGEWVKFTDLVQSSMDALDEIKAEKEALDCFADDLALIESTVADAKAALEAATDPAELDEIVNNAMAILTAIQSKADVVANAKAEVGAYKAGLFRDAEEAQRLAAVATASAAIDAANSSEEVATAVANAKATIDALKTANEYAKEEIADSVADAKSSLDSYKAEANLYREEEAAERLAIIAEAKAALDEALTEDEVETILANAKAAIDALKTDAEYDAEEYLAMVKEDSIAQIGEMKAAIDLSLYTEESILTISTLYNNAISAIQNANSEEEIASILTKFEADLDNVPKIGEENTSEPAAPSAPSGGGCFGGIGGLSSVFALLSVMAVAVVLKKRR